MSLTKAITRGINSATYNPEAEKALAEERKKASEAKQKFRDGLFKIRDTKTEAIQKKQASDYLIKNLDTIANDGFAWISANPDADVQTITDQAVATSEKVQDVMKGNVVVLALSILPQFYKTVASQAFLKKQITEDKKKVLENFADSISDWLKTAADKTSEQIYSKQQEIELKAKEVLEGTGEVQPVAKNEAEVAKAEKQVAATQEKVQKEEEADKNTFSGKRLITSVFSIAGKVVASLFIVMLILVSGMLTANDAIGRDPQYRILYFVFGGLGFPVMLLYYLYRWFTGTAPHIYRLLPLYTKESDTSIGRFFLFPFTYQEDAFAKDAYTKFMTEAAELVGKKYTPPAEKRTITLTSIVDRMEKIGLNASAAMKKAPANILAGLQKIELPS